ncbi:T6SS effector phospholipase Tle3 domain-containing protein, partial [Achromobacter spanius]|uniref:T6SS effector phospholipase Tle3 domain-containing protein n=1 Tax=Achromobacter spanius TaxID=217203 RepID=UPI00320B0D08
HPDGRSGEDDTINVVGHSQGNLITLLANAMLHDEGLRPIDGFVMMSPPYSLAETVFERIELGQAQQTTPARVQTLGNIVNFIGENPHQTPSLADMADASKDSCIGGLRWTGQQCETSIDGNTITFAERDNRGGVFLYFSPQDQTVGMINVQGIGWQGVGQTASYKAYVLEPFSTQHFNAANLMNGDDLVERMFLVPALSALGGRFFQRVFTTRERDGKGEEVGLPPSYAYTLLGQGRSREGERTWEGTELGSGRATVANANFSIGQTVTIQAPALPVPFLPDFVAGGTTLDRQGSRGIKPVWTPTDPIDASISITNGGIDVHTTRVITLSTDG